jgi:hypothetical protein
MLINTIKSKVFLFINNKVWSINIFGKRAVIDGNYSYNLNINDHYHSNFLTLPIKN